MKHTPARAFCAAMLPRVSRTFAVSILALPTGLREAVQTAYLLCRIVDTIEDDPKLRGEARRELFTVFDELLTNDQVPIAPFLKLCERSNAGTCAAERELCAGAAQVLRCFRSLPVTQRTAIRPQVLEMSSGMQEFSLRADQAGRLRIRDLEELERYCYFVAGTVGTLLTNLFANHIELDLEPSSELHMQALRFGIGLQLVNILKDIAEDATRGVCYLPEDLALRCGVDLASIMNPKAGTNGHELVRHLAQRASSHLESAERYTFAWPASELRFFCAVPLALAQLTLRKIVCDVSLLTRKRPPKINRWSVMSVIGAARSAVRYDEELREFFDRHRLFPSAFVSPAY